MSGAALLIREADVPLALRRRYAAKITRAQKAIGQLSKRREKQAIRDLEQARAAIMDQILSASEFGQWNLSNLRRALV